VVVDEAAGIELAIRVVAGDTSVQLIAQLGPLDISNGFGQEAVIELHAPAVTSATEWRTDANGLFMMQRSRRTNTSGIFPGYVVTEPEAQNYFPATTMAELRSVGGPDGGSGGPSLAVSFASSHGVTSLAAGTLEVMMHRRLVDHGCRVDQGFQMNDTYRIVKTLRVQALPSAKGLAVANRLDALHLHHPVAVYFPAATAALETATLPRRPLDIAPSAAADVADAARMRVLPRDLPAGLHLHTLRTSLGADLRCSPFPPRQCDDYAEAAAAATAAVAPLQVLIRLQHLFSAEDDPGGPLSQPVAIDLAAWLAGWLGRVLRIDETTLTAAAVIKTDVQNGGALTIYPMEIRTFIVTLLRA
jgi:hypothetical protein